MVGAVLALALTSVGQEGESTRVPGAVGNPYAGEWRGMTDEIYNGQWDFVYRSRKNTTYISQTVRTPARNQFEVTVAQVLRTPDASGRDLTVLVMNYQCSYRLMAILKIQGFRGSEQMAPRVVQPAPQSWDNQEAFETIGNSLCAEHSERLAGQPVLGLWSLRGDAEKRPISRSTR